MGELEGLVWVVRLLFGFFGGEVEAEDSLVDVLICI